MPIVSDILESFGSWNNTSELLSDDDGFVAGNLDELWNQYIDLIKLMEQQINRRVGYWEKWEHLPYILSANEKLDIAQKCFFAARDCYKDTDIENGNLNYIDCEKYLHEADDLLGEAVKIAQQNQRPPEEL